MIRKTNRCPGVIVLGINLVQVRWVVCRTACIKVA